MKNQKKSKSEVQERFFSSSNVKNLIWNPILDIFGDIGVKKEQNQKVFRTGSKISENFKKYPKLDLKNPTSLSKSDF